jgi:uncharacterized protein
MIARFADASYYLALLNPDDEFHEQAASLASGLTGTIVTSAWVLSELAGRLAAVANRRAFLSLVADLRAHRDVVIVRADQRSFELGLELYAQRPDKEWSLVDCISFNIMRKRRIAEALSADHHFEQAGFQVLLK